MSSRVETFLARADASEGTGQDTGAVSDDLGFRRFSGRVGLNGR
jgi:hypothetical protein